MLANLRCAVDTDSLGVFKVQEQQPNIWIDQDVAPCSVHAITVVIRNTQSAIIQEAHEPGQAAFIRAVRMAMGISWCDEKHGVTLNKRTVLVGKGCANSHLLQAVRQGPRLARILKLPHAIVIHRIVCHHSSSMSL